MLLSSRRICGIHPNSWHTRSLLRRLPNTKIIREVSRENREEG